MTKIKDGLRCGRVPPIENAGPIVALQNRDAQAVIAADGALLEDTAPYAVWAKLVERIRVCETDGMEELYRLFSKGIRFYLCRRLGPQDLDDKVHDTFVVVVRAIQKGELRDPRRLMGFVRTVVRRQVAAHIDRVVHLRREQVDMESTIRVSDSHGSPEEAAIFSERAG